MIWTMILALICFCAGLAVARAYRGDPALSEFCDALLTVVCLPFRAIRKAAATAAAPAAESPALAEGEVINGHHVPVGSALLGRPYPRDKP